MYQVYQTKNSDHYVLKDSRYISNKYSLVPMQLMLEKAIENDVPFINNYKKADPPVKYPFAECKASVLSSNSCRPFTLILMASKKDFAFAV